MERKGSKHFGVSGASTNAHRDASVGKREREVEGERERAEAILKIIPKYGTLKLNKGEHGMFQGPKKRGLNRVLGVILE